MNLRAVLGFSVGPLATVALGFVSIPVMTWLFAREDLGRLNVLLTAGSLAATGFSLGLDQAYLRNFHQTANRAQLFASTALPGACLLLLACVPLVLWSNHVSQLLFGQQEATLVWLLSAYAVSTFGARFFSLIVRMSERGLAYSLGQVLPRAVLLLGMVAAALDPSLAGFEYLAFLTSAGSATVLLAYAWKTRHDWCIRIGIPNILACQGPLLRYSLPLLVSSLAYWGLTSSTTLMLRAISDFSQLGFYSIAINCSGLAVALQLVFSTVWAPIAYRWTAESDTNATRVSGVMHQALPLGCLVITLSGSFAWVVVLLLPSEYDNIRLVLACVMIQPVMYTIAEITGIGITLSRRTAMMAISTVSALAANVAGCFLLIPSFGARGAIVSNAIAFSLYLAIRTEAGARLWHPIPRIGLYTSLSLVTALAIVTALAPVDVSRYLPFLWAAITVAILVRYKSDLADMVRLGVNERRSHHEAEKAR